MLPEAKISNYDRHTDFVGKISKFEKNKEHEIVKYKNCKIDKNERDFNNGSSR